MKIKARFDSELVMMVLLSVIAVASIKLKFWNKVDFNFHRYQLSFSMILISQLTRYCSDTNWVTGLPESGLKISLRTIKLNHGKLGNLMSNRGIYR